MSDNNDTASEAAGQVFLVLWIIALAWRFAIVLGWAWFGGADLWVDYRWLSDGGKLITPNDHIFLAWIQFWGMVLVPMITGTVGAIFGLAGTSVFGIIGILIWSAGILTTVYK